MHITSFALPTGTRKSVFRLNDDSNGAPTAFISTAPAGDMKTPAARVALAKEFGINPGRFRKLRQTHSRKVVTDPFKEQEGDGIITADPLAVPVVTVADCFPVYLFDTVENVFGLVHSGWKGTGIVADAVKAMVSSGCWPRNIIAIVGPGIGGCCYDVPEERARNFTILGNNVAIQRNGSWYLDLAAANRTLLEGAEVGEIRIVENCTSCDGRLGSFRRQGPDEYTHMLAGIGHF